MSTSIQTVVLRRRTCCGRSMGGALFRRSRLIMIATAAFAVASAAAADAPPNVLLIMTDDQGWGDLGTHGNSAIRTPQLDGLAAQSARFDRFFVSPVCAPTRASLLTGRYAARTGVSGVTGRREVMRADELTMAEAFAASGYATGCFGKWHNGEQFPNHPHGQGFQEFFGFCGGHWNQYFDTPLEHRGKPVATRGYITHRITDAAIEFVRRHAGADQPFFCYVPYNAPHTPWQVPDKYYRRYDDEELGKPTASAYAMIECIDEDVGRLLATIDKSGAADNTIVLFLTDNGPNGRRYNGGMRGAKGSVHEGGVRVPLLVRWPGRIKPQLVSRLAAHIDLLPTLAALCGVDLASLRRPDGAALRGKPLDGISLAGSLLGASPEDDSPDRQLFTYRWLRSGKVYGAVRTNRFRFTRDRDGDQLFDMQADPGQETNLAKSNPHQLQTLKAAFETFRDQASRASRNPTPIPVGHPQAARVELPAVEAKLAGAVSFRNGPGWAHDWIVNWLEPTDRITWPLEVKTAGRYEVRLQYAAAAEGIGSRLRLSAGPQSLAFRVTKPFTTPEADRPERDHSKGVRKMREFGVMRCGQITLPAGRVALELKARELKQLHGIEVGGLVLTKLP